jgi:hypothetical protein
VHCTGQEEGCWQSQVEAGGTEKHRSVLNRRASEVAVLKGAEGLWTRAAEQDSAPLKQPALVRHPHSRDGGQGMVKDPELRIARDGKWRHPVSPAAWQRL